MSKQQFSCRIDDEIMEYTNELIDEIGINRTNIPEFALRVIREYFSINQLKSEALVHAPKDGRKLRKVQK